MKKRGYGIGSIFYGTGYGNGYPDVSRATAALLEKGDIGIYVGATEVGQGVKTILLQIAAEVLGLKTEEVQIFCESTENTPDSGTAAASRQTYNTGNAVKKACEALKERLILIAKEKLGLNSSVGLRVENKRVFLSSFPKLGIDFSSIAEGYKATPLKFDGTFTAGTTEMQEETGQGAPYWPYTFSVYGVEVEVDTSTGLVEVIDAICAQDVGRAINPKLVEGQIDGGFAMGVGYALHEDLSLYKGEIANDRFSSYIIPTALDIPDINKILVEEPEATAPYGAKGIGEPVMLAVAPAILNAIYNATGVRMTEIPVTPDRLLKAIKDKERTGGS